jgi:hypothetical protein
VIGLQQAREQARQQEMELALEMVWEQEPGLEREPGLVKAQAQVPPLQNHHQSLVLAKQECLDLKSRILVRLEQER